MGIDLIFTDSIYFQRLLKLFVSLILIIGVVVGSVSAALILTGIAAHIRTCLTLRAALLIELLGD